MNTKTLSKDQQIIPEKSRDDRSDSLGGSPDSLVFDKAEKAESVEHLKEKYETTVNKIEEIENAISESEDDEKLQLQGQLDNLKEKSTRLSEIIQRAEEKLADRD